MEIGKKANWEKGYLGYSETSKRKFGERGNLGKQILKENGFIRKEEIWGGRHLGKGEIGKEIYWKLESNGQKIGIVKTSKFEIYE